MLRHWSQFVPNMSTDIEDMKVYIVIRKGRDRLNTGKVIRQTKVDLLRHFDNEF